METTELYQKQLEPILKLLNIVVNTDNINAKRYIDVEKTPSTRLSPSTPVYLIRTTMTN